ncbi:MAG: hypothetical protein CMP23_15875 [Rickettsiales bacterium]|nr:hypothetical protein [Rickettsiales bacterium]|tara:strand:- start:279 stop:1391 length:1113 start_codon:yes stop_codon:yes gene_type:complete
MGAEESSKILQLGSVEPVRKVATSRYIDPEFLELEKERIFRRAWLVACRSSDLERSGAYRCLSYFDESVVIIRDQNGELRAFHNTCRHRGSKLLEGCGRVKEITCPYHGWRYDLDGSLNAVPKAEGFERLATSRMKLLPVRCESWGGFIWLNLDPKAPPLEQSLGAIKDELAPYRLDEMEAIERKTFRLSVNWKTMLENVTDYYHVPVVHGRSVGVHVDSGPDLTGFGDHTRQRLDIAAYEFRRWLDARCSRGGPYSDKQLRALHKYLIFPNLLMNALPYHLTVMQVFPVSTQQCDLHYGFYKRRGARGLERLRAYGTWVASRYILREDFQIIHRFQQGISTGRLKNQQLHAEEAATSHFHGAIDRWLRD